MSDHEGAEVPRVHRRWVWLAHQGLVAASLGFFAWLLVKTDWSTLDPTTPLWVAAVLYVLAATLRPLMWVALLEVLSRGGATTTVDLESRARTWRDASRARMTRYLPGRVLNWTARFVIARRAGHHPDAIAESIAIDSLLPPLVLVAVALAAAAQTLSFMATILVTVVTLAVAVWGLADGRAILRRFLLARLPDHPNRFLTRVRVALAGEVMLPRGEIAVVVFLYFAWGVARTVAFVVLTISMTSLTFDDAGFIAAAGAIGGVAGQLTFIAPMGLGVREGVAGGILRGRLPVADAAGAVAATRIVQTIAELPALAITEAGYLVVRGLGARSAEAVPPATEFTQREASDSGSNGAAS